MNRMLDKYALITGGSSGIGLESARQFLAEGAHVAITGRSSSALREARESLGEKVIALEGDAGQVKDIEDMVGSLATFWPRVDVVFANAGDTTHMPLTEWSEQAWDHSIGVNLKGPFFLLQTLLPLLADNASVILCGSTSAHIAFPESSVYAAGKAGLLALARTLSAELLPRNIRVNVLSPGPTETPALKRGRTATAQQIFEAEVRSLVPIKRMGQVVEIAQAAVYLASDESRYMVGTELLLDGGVANLTPPSKL